MNAKIAKDAKGLLAGSKLQVSSRFIQRWCLDSESEIDL